VDNLSARLPDRAEFDEIAAGPDPGFFLELADRRREQVFAGFDLAFGNAPVAVVLVLEEGSAGMREENLRLTVAHSIHQQPGAGF